MQDHLFNNIIWPDFTKIPNVSNPVLIFNRIEAGLELAINGYNVKAIEVDHTVPAVGYIVSKDGVTLAYTGDTGPTDEFWRHVSGIDAMIVEVSFPDSMVELALLTKHLTCSLLKTELAKIEVLPRRIFITHPKPQYYDVIRQEVESLGIPGIELLHDGTVFNL
jgi:ribonuclease BN (tRNA processing enzyme)